MNPLSAIIVGALLIASLFVLVCMGKYDPGEYAALVTALLTAFGAHKATAYTPDKKSDPQNPTQGQG